MNLLALIDDVVMGIVLVLAFEQVRRVTFFTQPLATVIFGVMCVSAFGLLVNSLRGGTPAWWSVSEHMVLALLLLRGHNADPAHWSFLYGIANRQPPRVDRRTVPETTGRQRPHPSD